MWNRHPENPKIRQMCTNSQLSQPILMEISQILRICTKKTNISKLQKQREARKTRQFSRRQRGINPHSPSIYQSGTTDERINTARVLSKPHLFHQGRFLFCAVVAGTWRSAFAGLWLLSFSRAFAPGIIAPGWIRPSDCRGWRGDGLLRETLCLRYPLSWAPRCWAARDNHWVDLDTSRGGTRTGEADALEEPDEVGAVFSPSRVDDESESPLLRDAGDSSIITSWVSPTSSSSCIVELMSLMYISSDDLGEGISPPFGFQYLGAGKFLTLEEGELGLSSWSKRHWF